MRNLSPTHGSVSDGISPVSFSRFKYGREVCVDARPIESWNGVATSIATHRLDFHELLFVDRGRGTIWTDDQRRVICGPAIVVTAPGQVRRVELDQPIDGQLVVFTRDAADRFCGSGQHSTAVASSGVIGHPSAEPLSRVGAVTSAMQRELHDGYSDMPGMLEALLAQLLILLVRLDSTRLSPRPEPPILTRLRELVEAQFRVEHCASAYAAALGVSLDHLSAIARQHRFGSVKSIIQARIHREACRLLMHTNMTVAEIAFALGYAEPGHFARVFRQSAGFAPSRFRAARPEKYR